jgi:hypothetical protein
MNEEGTNDHFEIRNSLFDIRYSTCQKQNLFTWIGKRISSALGIWLLYVAGSKGQGSCRR